jgi:hypothetical protein
MLGRVVALCLCLFAHVAATSTSHPDKHLTKNLDYQKIKGFENGTLDLYLGVRYGSKPRLFRYSLSGIAI